MIPTLLIGDWLFVNKLAYGPTIPFTNSHLPGYTDPKHGDVVVFVSPYQAGQRANDPTPTLVKRLIGMPGDTLFMRDGVSSTSTALRNARGFAATNPTGDNNSSRRRSSTGSTQSSSKARASAHRPRSRRSTTGVRSSFRRITIS